MNLPTSSDIFVSLVQTVGPAVVRVEAPRQPGATGLLWSDDGLVLTGHHVLRRDGPIRVVIGDHEPTDATLLGRDPVTDLAVLRVDPTALTRVVDAPDASDASAASQAAPASPPLAPPTWLDGDDLRVGTLALALARPGRSVRAALGLVAVVGDHLRTPGGRSLSPYVELDRPLPRGFSVAPLVDLAGSVIGMATAGLVPDATVVLTASTVRASVDAIVAHGRVPQGFLGVGVSPARLPAALRQSLGQGRALAVVGLADDGPAASAGVQVGDLILTVGDQTVRSPAGLRALLADRAGQSVALRLLRGGHTTEINVTAGERQ